MSLLYVVAYISATRASSTSTRVFGFSATLRGWSLPRLLTFMVIGDEFKILSRSPSNAAMTRGSNWHDANSKVCTTGFRAAMLLAYISFGRFSFRSSESGRSQTMTFLNPPVGLSCKTFVDSSSPFRQQKLRSATTFSTSVFGGSVRTTRPLRTIGVGSSAARSADATRSKESNNRMGSPRNLRS